MVHAADRATAIQPSIEISKTLAGSALLWLGEPLELIRAVDGPAKNMRCPPASTDAPVASVKKSGQGPILRRRALPGWTANQHSWH